MSPNGQKESQDYREDHLNVGPRIESKHTEDQQVHQLEYQDNHILKRTETETPEPPTCRQVKM